MNEMMPKEEFSGEHGFSLLELLVSMTIFLIVSASVWGLLRTAQQSRTTVNEQVQLAKNLRVSLNLISRDAYNAGYGYPAASTVILPDNRISTRIGVPTDSDTTRDIVPPIISGNNITLNTFSATPNTRTDQVTFFFKDSTFNAASGFSQPLLINSRTTATGGVVELSPVNGNSTCRPNDIFLLTGTFGTVSGPITSTIAVATGVSGTSKVQFSNGDQLGFNLTAGSGVLNEIYATAMYRVRMVTYFVTADGTLTRREFANVLPVAQFVDEPLVYNVEDFQIEYVMDDGTVSDNPSAGPDEVAGTADDVQANLAEIRQIRLTVTTRSMDRQSNGDYFRETMTTTVSTRNLGYEAS